MSSLTKLVLTHTFSDSVENHTGMKITGKRADVGFSEEELKHIAENCNQSGISLVEMACNGERANVLVWKGGVEAMMGKDGPDKLLQESLGKSFDATYLDMRRNRVLNKHGRQNNCYADQAESPDIAHGRGTVHSFANAPMMAGMRDQLPKYLGRKAANLFAESNKYTDISNKLVGIGFHGDTERRLVIGVRLGPASVDMPLRFQWYQKAKPISDEIVVPLAHGDIYVMSDKAVGFDWRCSSKTTLRHGAGRKARKRPREGA